MSKNAFPKCKKQIVIFTFSDTQKSVFECNDLQRSSAIVKRSLAPLSKQLKLNYLSSELITPRCATCKMQSRQSRAHNSRYFCPLKYTQCACNIMQRAHLQNARERRLCAQRERFPKQHATAADNLYVVSPCQNGAIFMHAHGAVETQREKEKGD